MDPVPVVKYKQKIAWAAVISLSIAHFLWLASYHEPAISTPDANSYFAQARLIALEGTTSFSQESVIQFIGPHWNRSENDRYYCTQPPGLGIILALPYLLFGYKSATWFNPVMASLCLILIFLLCLRTAGPYHALLGAALMAMNPFFNEHALFGDSHIAVNFLLLASLLCLFQMIKKEQSSLWGLCAGLLAGTIPSLRYAESLYLPAFAFFLILMACCKKIKLRSILTFAIGTAFPIILILIRNQAIYGTFWKTGYMTTGEQAAFGIETLVHYSPVYIWKLFMEGAFLMLPLGVGGIFTLLIGRNSRDEGLLLVCLIIPISLLYMAYYWGPDPQSMRFFIPTFSLYTLSGIQLLSRIIKKPRYAFLIFFIILVLTALWGMPKSVKSIRILEHNNGVLADITEILKKHVPEGSIVIANMGIQQHLDFVGGWKLAKGLILNPEVTFRPGHIHLIQSGPMRLEQPMPFLEAHWKGYFDELWKWAGHEKQVFIAAKLAQVNRLKPRLPVGIHLEQLECLRLPDERKSWLNRPDSNMPMVPLPGPPPNSIFDIDLDGQELCLFECKH